MANRTFTLNEAQQLIPVLENMLRQAIDSKRRSDEIDSQFQQVNSKIMMNGGMMLDIVPLAHLRAERDKLGQSITDTLAEIGAMGVQIKDLDIGLLDFPCVVEGKVVLLCWKLGEEGIAYWHGTDEGFASRKPINDKIVNAGRARRKSN